MEYKVFIFSKDVLDGQFKFDFNKFYKVCAYNMIDIQSFDIKDFVLDRPFIEKDKNLIVFCNNDNLDNLIIRNIEHLGNKKTIVEEQIAVFNQNGYNIIFMPLESDLELLNKVFTKSQDKKYCEFHLFGLPQQQVINKLEQLRQEIPGFKYKIIYDNLLCDLIICYNGQSTLIDDNQVKIATAFKQYVYSENYMYLPEIIRKMLALRGKSLAICENITKGELVNSLLESDEEFETNLKKVVFEKVDYIDNETLYNKTMEFLKDAKSDIALVMSGRYKDGALEFVFAIADAFEVHIFKNSFKADKRACIEMAKNAVLFHLAKKLRQNDLSF